MILYIPTRENLLMGVEKDGRYMILVNLVEGNAKGDTWEMAHV